MQFNYLNSQEKRKVIACNFNRHEGSCHPDRVLEEHDIIYIRSGSWVIGQDGVDYTLQAGDVILLQGYHHHYGPKPCQGTVNTCYIHFSCVETDVVGEGLSREDRYVFPMVVHCQGNPIVEKYFSQAIYAFYDEDIYGRKKAEAYLDLLLCELSRQEKNQQSMAEHIKMLIRRHPDRFVSNQEIAGNLNCSVRTATGKFKNATGTTIHAWQMMHKCKMAEELIQYTPGITLKEVAATYGFYDEYHFGKCFKKIMGHTPKRGE